MSIARFSRKAYRRTVGRAIRAMRGKKTHDTEKAFIGDNVRGIQGVEFCGRNKVSAGTVFRGEVVLGYGTAIGPNCLLRGPISFGNYCHFGPSAVIVTDNHTSSYAAQYVDPALFEGRMLQHIEPEKVVVGHDVWIGQNAIITKGVHIGNGAIVGAGAVARRDALPYSIVQGNPARRTGMRFQQEIIDLLQRFRWWSIPPEELAEYEDIFHVNLNEEPEKGIALLTEAVAERERMTH